MVIPKVNTCCCGCSLRTGTKILGWLNLIGGLLLVFSLSINAKNIHTLSAEIKELEFDNVLHGLKIVLIITAILSAFQFIFAIILLIGAEKEKASYIKLWIIFQLVAMAFIFITSLALIILYFKQGNSPHGIGQIISLTINEGLSAYFVIVVNSYRMEILSAAK